MKTTLYGLYFRGRYAAFDSYHTSSSKQLFLTKEEAENYIPEYKDHMIKLCKEMHNGFYILDENVPMKLTVVDYEIELP